MTFPLFKDGMLLFAASGQLAGNEECCCPVSCGAPWITGLYDTAAKKGNAVCGPNLGYSPLCREDVAWGALVTRPNDNWSACGWISTVCDSNTEFGQPAEIADYDFSLTFCIAEGIDPTTIDLSGVFRADNYLKSLKLNGTDGTATLGFPGFNQFSGAPYPFSFPSSALVTGSNTVVFTVTNDSNDGAITVQSPMGLCVIWDCCFGFE